MKISACPFCGGAAERGYIQSSRQIIWSGEKKEGFFLAGDGDIKITEGTLKPGIAESAAANNDKYLICSDGVTDMLEDSEIKRILKQNNSERDIVGELIEKAKDKGGRDNITAIVLKIEIDKKRLFSFRRKKNEAVKENVR